MKILARRGVAPMANTSPVADTRVGAAGTITVAEFAASSSDAFFQMSADIEPDGNGRP